MPPTSSVFFLLESTSSSFSHTYISLSILFSSRSVVCLSSSRNLSALHRSFLRTNTLNVPSSRARAPLSRRLSISLSRHISRYPRLARRGDSPGLRPTLFWLEGSKIALIEARSRLARCLSLGVPTRKLLLCFASARAMDSLAPTPPPPPWRLLFLSPSPSVAFPHFPSLSCSTNRPLYSFPLSEVRITKQKSRERKTFRFSRSRFSFQSRRRTNQKKRRQLETPY